MQSIKTEFILVSAIVVNHVDNSLEGGRCGVFFLSPLAVLSSLVLLTFFAFV